ncbi:hypothetical protein DMN91_006114 [Ooceraea biroi]|uniref:Uncharacterized protein n=1 Tax=Ooceraea biroi TaxID=2015173 RepID=A0A3L8DPJ2_OOCBI|nr:hypothetical protein DMN91_006114 [Ooceraea biroi]
MNVSDNLLRILGCGEAIADTTGAFYTRLTATKSNSKVPFIATYIRLEHKAVGGERTWNFGIAEPHGLARGIPDKMFVYCDICEPYITGDVQTPLLQIVPIELDDYDHSQAYGANQVIHFAHPHYIPLLRTNFRRIEIGIKDHLGKRIPFQSGTLTSGRGGGIPRIFVGAPYQRGHGIGSFLGGLFMRVLPYLGKGARAVGKEALRAGLSVLEDVGNNTPLKEAVKTTVLQEFDARESISMFFLHTHSSECLKSELDLFSLPPTQTSIESSQWIYYKSVTSFGEDTPIEFVILGHREDYLDLMLSLHIRVDSSALAGGGGSNVPGTSVIKVGPVNHLLHSMFNQIDVYFNQKLVSPPNNAYAYRTYIEALLNYSSPAKTSHLTSCLWDADTPGLLDALLDSATPNPALVRRVCHTRANHALDLMGHLHCDVFNQDKFLINGVEVRMSLVRSIDAFCLMEIGFVDNKAFNGDRKLNPFNFKNYGINFFSLYVDGVQIPSRPLQPSFSKDEPLCVEAFHSLFSGTSIHFLNEGNSISREDYAEGFTLFAFDLTSDLSANCAGHWNLVKHGSLRLEVRFEKPLAATVNCIVYAEFDNVLEIDSSRQIIVDFAG